MEEVLKKLTLEFFGQGKHKTTPEQFFAGEGGVFLDVRSREEAESVAITLKHHSHITPLNIPVHEIPERIGEIPEDKAIVVFCPANVRSAIVYAFLLSKGYTNVRILEGGYAALTEALKPGKVFKVVAKQGKEQ